MHELVELMDKIHGISDAIESREYGKAISILPTDIRYLRQVLGHLEVLGSMSRHGTLCWLTTLLNNPLSLRLMTEDVQRAVRFLLETSLEGAVAKLSLRCLALLISRTCSSHSHSDSGFSICGVEVSRVTYYVFLNYLSRLEHVDPEAVGKEDGVEIKRMKIKIMSNSPGEETLRTYLDMLNEGNARLGWTLCKSFLKVAKHFETEAVVAELKRRCDVIFANENMWINIMTILGIMVLNGWDIGDVSDIISKTVYYNNEVVHSSEKVREAGLFLVWTLVRSSGVLDERHLHLAIARSLSDSSLCCRRSAAAVVLECVGRGQRDFGSRLLSLVNFHSVRRLNTCSAIVGEVLGLVPCGEALEDALIRNILHPRLETKEQSGHCIARHFRGHKAVSYLESTDFRTPSDLVSLLVFIREFVREGRTGELRNVTRIVAELRIDDRFSRYRDFDVFVMYYTERIVDLRMFGDDDAICENLYFILAKNIHPDRVSRACWELVDTNPGFADKLYVSLRRNTEGFIVANARNTRHRDGVERRYMDNLERGDIDRKIFSMRAVRHTESPGRYAEYIHSNLENYSVDSRGDFSAELRKESLLASFLLADETTPSRYFVRYLVDKSKMLRDECILICRSSGIFDCGFEYISRRGSSVDVCKLGPVRSFLEDFHRTFRQLELTSEMGNDTMVFAAAISASAGLGKSHYREFVLGMLGSIGHSDTSLHLFILDSLFRDRLRILDVITELLESGFKDTERLVHSVLVAIDHWVEAEVKDWDVHRNMDTCLYVCNTCIRTSISKLMGSSVEGRNISVGRRILDTMDAFSSQIN